MEATAREIVELASTDYELADISDRQTDIPVAPSVPPLDLDTTQVVPKLVLSELRYQARMRSNPGAAALAANDEIDVEVDVVATPHAEPTLDVEKPSHAAKADVASAIVEGARPSRALGGAVAIGVGIGVVAIALVAGVLALAY